MFGLAGAMCVCYLVKAKYEREIANILGWETKMTEREILEQSIKEHKAAIAKAEAEVAELDKPKFKVGDFGKHSISDEFTFFVHDIKDGRVRFIWTDTKGLHWTTDWSIDDNSFSDFEVKGNVFSR